MNEELRNSLWNALMMFYWDKVQLTPLDRYISDETPFRILWHNYFKKPLDTLDSRWDETIGEIRDYFFHCTWYEVYDFIEFMANNHPERYTNPKFMDFCNTILERELSAYRFVGEKITQITSEEEIAEIEEALEVPLKPVTNHLKRALDLFADRKSPDYRNSIKESISAVEAICRLIAHNPKATLGDALKEIEKENKVELHSALKNAFNNLYGFTSDAEGIRHALKKEPNLDFEDAKFMLISCSAFINYLISKSSKAGIKL